MEGVGLVLVPLGWVYELLPPGETEPPPPMDLELLPPCEMEPLLIE